MKMVEKKSQCACCGKTFTIKSEEQILYCKPSCEQVHDLFRKERFHETLRKVDL
jgi:hypothetical protein